MRPSQKQNRARGRGNRNKPNGNIVNRVFESAGPEGKVRGTPQQIIDKYLTLARDAQTSGDRVISENFLQHAEHYQRILVEAQGLGDEQRRDQREHGGPDGDGHDEFDDHDAGQGERQPGQRQPEQAADERGEQRTDQRGGGRRGDRSGDRSGDRGGDRSGDRTGDLGDGDQGGGERRSGEVSGLTTIDSGSNEGGSLLVDADELSASQPPRRRRNQRRDRGQQDQQSEADAQSD